MEKVWKGVIYNKKDLSSRLEVSNYGDLRNAKTKRVYRLNLINKYLACVVSLGSRENKVAIRIHKAVAETFIENSDNKPIINHIDGDKINNNVKNLEWCTYKENSKHAKEMGLLAKYHVKGSFLEFLSLEDVEYIRKNYKPYDKNFGARPMSRKFNISHQTILKIINRDDLYDIKNQLESE